MLNDKVIWLVFFFLLLLGVILFLALDNHRLDDLNKTFGIISSIGTLLTASFAGFAVNSWKKQHNYSKAIDLRLELKNIFEKNKGILIESLSSKKNACMNVLSSEFYHPKKNLDYNKMYYECELKISSMRNFISKEKMSLITCEYKKFQNEMQKLTHEINTYEYFPNSDEGKLETLQQKINSAFENPLPSIESLYK